MADLVTLRDDPGAFAMEVSAEPLTDWQLDELRAAPRSSITSWLWGRQSGKS